MTIAFTQIPIDLRIPGVFIENDNTRASSGLPIEHHKILVMGQRLTTGTVAEKITKRITSPTQAEEYFGRGSMLWAMLKALKKANDYTECWAIALDEATAGVKATGSIVIGGTVTAAGTLPFYVAGLKVPIAVATAEANASSATALAAAINADTTLPITAAVDGQNSSKVNVTCKWKGVTGNDIDLRTCYYQSEKLPSGMTITITTMTSGATNPDIDDAIAAIGDEQYNTIIIPWTDEANLTSIYTEMQRRWHATVLKEGHVFACVSGSHSDIGTIGNGLNDECLTVMGAQKTPTTPWEFAAILGAVDAYEPDPARQRTTLPLTGVMAPKEEDRYQGSEQNLHLWDGISTYYVDSSGICRIQRLITTYQTNALGVDDVSYLNVETMRTIAYLRYSTRTWIRQKYPRHKLADDGTPIAPGQPIVTPKTLISEMIALFYLWMKSGLVQNLEMFKKELIIERNTSDRDRADAIIPPEIIGNFRIFAAALQFRL